MIICKAQESFNASVNMLIRYFFSHRATKEVSSGSFNVIFLAAAILFIDGRPCNTFSFFFESDLYLLHLNNMFRLTFCFAV